MAKPLPSGSRISMWLSRQGLKTADDLLVGAGVAALCSLRSMPREKTTPLLNSGLSKKPLYCSAAILRRASSTSSSLALG